MKRKGILIGLCVVVAVSALFVYGNMTLNQKDKVKAEVTTINYDGFNTLVNDLSKEIKLDNIKLNTKVEYKTKEESGELKKIINKATGSTYTYTPIDPATFVKTEEGSLASAYNTGYRGTITIPDASVYGASLYRSSDASIIDTNIYATEVLSWSGVIGVSGSAPVICGHNNIGVFGGFGSLSVGSKIYFDLDYGQFIYEVTGFAIGDVIDNNIYFSGTDIATYGQGGGSQMVLYTCYPLTAHPAVQRYIVYATLVDGTALS